MVFCYLTAGVLLFQQLRLGLELLLGFGEVGLEFVQETLGRLLRDPGFLELPLELVNLYLQADPFPRLDALELLVARERQPEFLVNLLELTGLLLVGRNLVVFNFLFDEQVGQIVNVHHELLHLRLGIVFGLLQFLSEVGVFLHVAGLIGQQIAHFEGQAQDVPFELLVGCSQLLVGLGHRCCRPGAIPLLAVALSVQYLGLGLRGGLGVQPGVSSPEAEVLLPEPLDDLHEFLGSHPLLALHFAEPAGLLLDVPELEDLLLVLPLAEGPHGPAVLLGAVHPPPLGAGRQHLQQLVLV